jgi:hypothetical protein
MPSPWPSLAVWTTKQKEINNEFSRPALFGEGIFTKL